MSRLEELIQTLCPDGVENKTVGEFCVVYTGGEAPEDVRDQPLCQRLLVGGAVVCWRHRRSMSQASGEAARILTRGWELPRNPEIGTRVESRAHESALVAIWRTDLRIRHTSRADQSAGSPSTMLRRAATCAA